MVIRVFSIVGTLILFVFGIQSYYRTKKIFRNHQNLKDYEGYEIFTNQRYIEKNPSKFLYRKRDFTCYRKDSYELNSDLLSIDFDKIDYIVYNDILNVILFMTELHLEKYKDYASLSDYASQKLDYREEFIFLELEGRKESAAMHIMALLQENVSIQRKIKVDRGIILVLG